MLEIYGLIILAVLIFFWTPFTSWTTRFGAPFVPMEPRVVDRVIKLAEIKKGDVFFDLGSGDGRLVIAAAMKDARAYGVEIDLLRVFYSRFWLWLLRLKNAKILRQDFFKTDLSKADVVCLFLLQETNQKLRRKLEKELKPGTRVISYAFTFEGWQPSRRAESGGLYGSLFIYQIG